GERDLLLVDEGLAVLVHADDDLIRAGLGDRALHLGRHLDAVAHLGQRRRDHEDDEHHEHHVDERRNVDVALDSAAATYAHCHDTYLRVRVLFTDRFYSFFFLSVTRPTRVKPASLMSRITLRTSL